MRLLANWPRSKACPASWTRELTSYLLRLVRHTVLGPCSRIPGQCGNKTPQHSPGTSCLLEALLPGSCRTMKVADKATSLARNCSTVERIVKFRRMHSSAVYQLVLDLPQYTNFFTHSRWLLSHFVFQDWSCRPLFLSGESQGAKSYNNRTNVVNFF